MTSVNSHIQPKFYLKGFLAPKDDPIHSDSLFVYKKGLPYKTEGTKKEKNPAKCGLDNIAFVTNFYSFIKEDGTEDPQTYERRLEHEIESPGNQVLRKLRPIELKAGQTLQIRKELTADEQTNFARYVAGMIARTKSARELHDDSVHKTVAETNQKKLSFAEMSETASPEERSRFLQRLRANEPDFDEATGRFGLPPKFAADFTEEAIKGEAYPSGIFGIIDLLAPRIMTMRWQIRLTPAANALPTGDEPVYYTNLTVPNAILIFPISSNAVFCAYSKPATDEIIFLEGNPEIVNDSIRTFATKCRELYYSIQDERVVDLFNGKK